MSFAIRGYASLFNLPDQSGDIVMPGAFRKSLAAPGRAPVRMLFQHDPAEPVGVWSLIHETARGLWVEGHLTKGVWKARDLEALIRDGAIDGLSIGFRTLSASRERATGYRRLHRVDLWEISLVTFPMLTHARLTARRNSSPTQGV